jgi:cell division protein ZipA
MSELRWILIGFGIVLLAGIYLWGRRGSRTVSSDDAVVRVRPEQSVQSREPSTSRTETLLPPESERSAQTSASLRVDDKRIEEYTITAVRAASPRSSAPRAGGSDTVAAAARPAEDTRRGRVEPTLDNDPGLRADVHDEPLSESRDDTADLTQTAELAAGSASASAAAPTLSSSESPPVRRIERRKILALRLAAGPHRFDGAKLQESLQSESLEHGKYSVFHRMHTDGTSLFSVASMVEPGTFDLEKMGETQYPGITLFAQLPGPVPGMHALNELVACARRLQQSLGGVLQDDRGVPLTVHRIERLRQEVREFERPPAGAGGGGRGSPASPTMST